MASSRKKRAPAKMPVDGPPDWKQRVAETDGKRYAYGRVRVGSATEWCAVIFDVTGLTPVRAHPATVADVAEARALEWMEDGASE